MAICIFEVAGYTPDRFEFEPLKIFALIYIIFLEISGNDWNNPILNEECDSPQP